MVKAKEGYNIDSPEVISNIPSSSSDGEGESIVSTPAPEGPLEGNYQEQKEHKSSRRPRPSSSKTPASYIPDDTASTKAIEQEMTKVSHRKLNPASFGLSRHHRPTHYSSSRFSSGDPGVYDSASTPRVFKRRVTKEFGVEYIE